MRTLSETRLEMKRRRKVRPGSAEARYDRDRSVGILAPLEAADAEIAAQSCGCPSTPPPRRSPKTAIAADPAGDKPARRFSQIVKTARQWFLVFECDDVTKVARGIIPSQNGRAHMGTFSFGEDSGSLRLEVGLGQHRQPSESQVRAWLQTNGHQGPSHLWFDAEDAVLWARAAGPCRRLDREAAFVARALARDVHHMLEDELLQNSLAYGSSGCSGDLGKGGQV